MQLKSQMPLLVVNVSVLVAFLGGVAHIMYYEDPTEPQGRELNVKGEDVAADIVPAFAESLDVVDMNGMSMIVPDEARMFQSDALDPVRHLSKCEPEKEQRSLH